MKTLSVILTLLILLSSMARGEIPKGEYVVTESTHGWFQKGFLERISPGYLNERTSDHGGNDDWFYKLEYISPGRLTLQMSNSDCTELGNVLHAADYFVKGGTVTLKFDNGDTMTMKLKPPVN